MQKNKNFAVIWDMDGVIVDTAHDHYESWRQAFEKRGIKLTEADFQTKFGQRNDRIIRTTMNREVSNEEIEEIARDKEEYFRAHVRAHIKPFPGAVELIQSLCNVTVKMSIASSAPVENIRLLLGSLGILECFQQFVSGREVTESKPSPQIYLLAARKLNMPPEKCIVIEDAVTGVRGAKSAGMYCVAVTNTNSRELLREADMVVDNLTELTISSLENLAGIKHNQGRN